MGSPNCFRKYQLFLRMNLNLFLLHNVEVTIIFFKGRIDIIRQVILTKCCSIEFFKKKKIYIQQFVRKLDNNWLKFLNCQSNIQLNTQLLSSYDRCYKFNTLVRSLFHCQSIINFQNEVDFAGTIVTKLVSILIVTVREF